MSDDIVLEEPSTYAEIAKEAIVENQHYLWLSIGLFFGLGFISLGSVLVHLHVTEIAIVAAAEIDVHSVESYYVGTALYGLLMVCAFHEYLRTRGGNHEQRR